MHREHLCGHLVQNTTISIERLKTTLGESAVEGALEDFVEFVLANLR